MVLRGSAWLSLALSLSPEGSVRVLHPSRLQDVAFTFAAMAEACRRLVRLSQRVHGQDPTQKLPSLKRRRIIQRCAPLRQKRQAATHRGTSASPPTSHSCADWGLSLGVCSETHVGTLSHTPHTPHPSARNAEPRLRGPRGTSRPPPCCSKYDPPCTDPGDLCALNSPSPCHSPFDLSSWI